MTPPTDPEIARYLSGEANAAERQSIERRIAADADFAADVEKLRAAWAEGTKRQSYDSSALWERVAVDTINAPADSPSAPPIGSRLHLIRPMRPNPTNRWLAIAAALVLAIGPLSMWVFFRPSDESASSARSETRQVTTHRAQRADIYLSDGTQVKLGPASTLRFASVFSKTRDIYLEGQAYFDVAHDTARPFTVHTARGIARDLGTKFAVRAYTDDRRKDLEVVVAEGIVALGRAATGDSVLLYAADLGRITATGDLETQANVDVQAQLGWTEGRLEFKNAPLADVLLVISRWYDADVRVASANPELSEYPITATLTGERFADAIDVVARAIDARVVKHDSGLFLLRK